MSTAAAPRHRGPARAVAAPPPVAAARAGYILGPLPDLGLMVAAPAWIAPAVFLVAALLGDRAVADTVAAAGAIGHHLPGMLRAYGDRALFARFRTRFLLAPLLLAAVCVFFSTQGLHGVVFVAFAWGVWHALAQSYGFARIYGAKAGVTDRASARADRALLVTWFLAAVAVSPLRLAYLLDLLESCGLPLPSAGAVLGVRALSLGAAGVATLAWLVVVARAARAGRGPGWVRLVLLASSIGFWWFANVRVRHLLLCTTLFELFHDAQYLTIVWVYNRRRVEQGAGQIAAPLAVLFRPTAPAIAAYVAAVAGYGALSLFSSAASLGPVVTGLVAASQLLHFYYDGFIWRVREPATGAVLGVADTGVRDRAWLGPGLRHALLWSLMAVPCLGLWYGEVHAGTPPAQRRLDVAALVPDNALLRFDAAEIAWERGLRPQALEGFRAVLALDPGHAGARRNLALSLVELGDAAFDEGDREAVRRYGGELLAIRPGLAPRDAAFVEEKLARWRTLPSR